MCRISYTKKSQIVWVHTCMGAKASRINKRHGQWFDPLAKCTQLGNTKSTAVENTEPVGQ